MANFIARDSGHRDSRQSEQNRPGNTSCRANPDDEIIPSSRLSRVLGVWDCNFIKIYIVIVPTSLQNKDKVKRDELLQSCFKGSAEPALSVIYSSASRPSYKGWATRG
ncbi:unnamed protein product [Pieris brassicae]|uniref:Uncharacterized protein n=1 Tax=Pieris brassicae TaxID=7116 RepID=A0A9P0X663_PIEBR|nr:unnamed protein product [Pieris brassicae]